MKFPKALLVLAVAPLLLGSTNSPQPKLVAHASTLSPETYQPKPTQPLVEETVRYATTTTTSQNEPQSAPQGVTSDSGTGGFSLAGGNCVDLAKQYGKNQPGNPISWSVATMTPAIGEAVLFNWNHVGVVMGVNADGSFNVGQYNCPSCATRWTVGQVRGFF